MTDPFDLGDFLNPHFMDDSAATMAAFQQQELQRQQQEADLRRQQEEDERRRAESEQQLYRLLDDHAREREQQHLEQLRMQADDLLLSQAGAFALPHSGFPMADFSTDPIDLPEDLIESIIDRADRQTATKDPITALERIKKILSEDAHKPWAGKDSTERDQGTRGRET